MVGQQGTPFVVRAGTAGPAAAGLDAQDVQQLLEAVARLVESSASLDAFRQDFVRLVVPALRAAGGAVWEPGPDGHWQTRAAIRLEALGLDEMSGWDAHAGLLELARRRGKPLGVPAQSSPPPGDEHVLAANLTGHTLVLAPVVREGDAREVIEVWLGPPLESRERRFITQLVGELAAFAAAFHERLRLRELTAEQQLWRDLGTFGEKVHASLDPHEVAAVIANEARRLLDCDQAAVAVRPRSATRIEAVSGVPTVERRSRVVRALARLCDAVIGWGEPLTYAGCRDETLPPAVASALDAYLAEGNSRALVVLPLRRGGPEDVCRAALVAESFTNAEGVEALRDRAQILARSAAPAVANALAFRDVPLHGLARPLAFVRRQTAGRLAAGLLLFVLPVMLGSGLLVYVRVPLRLEARGRLVPQERQVVYAPVAGRVVDLKVRPGDAVARGQEILLIEDLETQLQADQLNIKIGAAEQRLALLSEQLGKGLPAERSDELVKERIDQEFELRRAAAERDILLQTTRTPRRTPAAAPLAGTVVTYDAHETLVGRTVKPGDPLLRVANVSGPWELDVAIPEAHVGPVRAALAAAGALDVDFLLSSHPHRRFRGRLTAAGLGGEATTKDNAVVLPARVQIADPDLPALLADLPVGVELHAKIDCGRRPAGYVWFYEVWEFVYEHLLF